MWKLIQKNAATNLPNCEHLWWLWSDNLRDHTKCKKIEVNKKKTVWKVVAVPDLSSLYSWKRGIFLLEILCMIIQYDVEEERGKSKSKLKIKRGLN